MSTFGVFFIKFYYTNIIQKSSALYITLQQISAIHSIQKNDFFSIFSLFIVYVKLNEADKKMLKIS